MKKSEAATMMGLERELRDAANSLTRCNPTAISLQAGCELFLRFVTRTAAHSLESENFDVCKVKRGCKMNHCAGTGCRLNRPLTPAADGDCCQSWLSVRMGGREEGQQGVLAWAARAPS